MKSSTYTCLILKTKSSSLKQKVYDAMKLNSTPSMHVITNDGFEVYVRKKDIGLAEKIIKTITDGEMY